MAIVTSTAPVDGGRIFSGPLKPGDSWEITFNTGPGGTGGGLVSAEYHASIGPKSWKAFQADGTTPLSPGGVSDGSTDTPVFGFWVNTLSPVQWNQRVGLKPNPWPQEQPTLNPNTPYVWVLTVNADLDPSVDYGSFCDYSPPRTDWRNKPVIGVGGGQ